MINLQSHLTDVCGLRNRRTTAMQSNNGPGLHIVYTLATNYNMKPSENLQESYDKLVDAVQDVFGEKKPVMW